MSDVDDFGNEETASKLEQCTYECKEINKRSVGKAVVKFCGNEGSDDDEKQAILRRLLQAIITYFEKGDEKPKVWSNVEVRIYVDIDVVFTIRAGEGYYQFIALFDHLDQPQVAKTTPSRHGQHKKGKNTSEQQKDESLSRPSFSYFQAFKNKFFG